jgi:hypothetical protein
MRVGKVGVALSWWQAAVELLWVGSGLGRGRSVRFGCNRLHAFNRPTGCPSLSCVFGCPAAAIVVCDLSPCVFHRAEAVAGCCKHTVWLWVWKQQPL